MNMVEVVGLHKRFGARVVLRDVGFAVPAGKVTAIIGPNGAGKTTTVETVLGLHQPDAGRIRFWRDDWRLFTSAQLQSVPLFPGLSAVDNVRIFAAFYNRRLTRADAVAELARFGLAEVERKPTGQLSGGQQKRLALALALLQKPALVFLDEPTGDLDPRGRHEIRALIQSSRRADTAVVMTSHDMEEVARVADEVVLIIAGRVQAQGTPEALLKRHGVGRLEDLYLQLTEEAEA